MVVELGGYREGIKGSSRGGERGSRLMVIECIRATPPPYFIKCCPPPQVHQLTLFLDQNIFNTGFSWLAPSKSNSLESFVGSGKVFVTERKFCSGKRLWQFSPRTKSQTRLLLKLNSRQVEGGRREDNFAFDELGCVVLIS